MREMPNRKRVRYNLVTKQSADPWCERGDSNPHGFTRQILSLVRLPIPPLSHFPWAVALRCYDAP